MSRRYRPFDPFERGGSFEGAREFRMPPVPRRFWGGVAFFALAVLIFVLGQDISFYLLTLPFLHAVVNWSLGLDFLALLLIGALYAWRGDAFDFRPTTGAIAHLSVLIAAFAITLSVGAWLGRYDLLYA